MNLEPHIDAAVSYILKQHALGYPNATHRMGAYSTRKFVELYQHELDLPASTVERFTNFTCEGKIFHVALITDALIDAKEAGYTACDGSIKENVSSLIDAREGRAWRYFPGFEPLPHDADDLGQIAQVLVRTGQADPHIMDDAFAFAEENAWEDGAINTWMVSTPAQRDKANKVWGRGKDDTGKDSEVVANLLYAVLLYVRAMPSTTFTPLLKRGVEWLVAQQQPMGFWRASWYVGTCYSTYAAVRLLAAYGGFARHVRGAVAFMAQAPGTDPLNRAFGLLAAVAGGENPSVDDMAFLCETQMQDGSWEAIPLLDNHARVWGSRAITTAFCLKALVAAQSRAVP